MNPAPDHDVLKLPGLNKMTDLPLGKADAGGKLLRRFKLLSVHSAGLLEKSAPALATCMFAQTRAGAIAGSADSVINATCLLASPRRRRAAD